MTLLTPYPQGVANTGPSVPSLKTPGPAAAVSSSASSSGNPRVLKTGMIFKKQTGAEMMKGVRDDIEEEDSEESYYRWSLYLLTMIGSMIILYLLYSFLDG